MKSLFLTFSLPLVLAFSLHAEPEAAGDSRKVLAEIRAQQVVLQQNQEKIDARMAAIAEQLRQARIFVSRGGSK